MKKLFKGTIHLDDGSGNMILDDRFYNGVDNPFAAPADSEMKPYSEIQAFDVWNQYRNPVRKFEVQIQGIRSSSLDSDGYVNTPHLLHRFIIVNYQSSHAYNRQFMLLTFDIDWYLCELRGTLIEIHNNDIGKQYGDDHETKFI